MFILHTIYIYIYIYIHTLLSGSRKAFPRRRLLGELEDVIHLLFALFVCYFTMCYNGLVVASRIQLSIVCVFV